MDSFDTLTFSILPTPCGLLRITCARSFFARLRGLLARPPLDATEALLIAPCNSVHTVGMRYAIDVVFLDRDERIVRIVRDLRPLRFAWCPRAKAVLECRAGTAERAGWRVGDCLALGDEKRGQR
ncbi:MAG: DUF192 domain-containing protein [Betaproteobacteria bacterium]|nr:DUF192 domain-containing protein [Betaproteobacteria bacterium]